MLQIVPLKHYIRSSEHIEKILIFHYNYEQLKQIGSDAYIYTGDKDGKIGSGEVVKSEGTELKYGADAQYILMNDIQMSTEQMWSVPDSFTGTITGTEVEENETPTLYDKETDTIYIYNPYQLMVLAQEESETEPVMTLDYDAPQFGMGQMIYPDGEDQEYLTYSKSHKYVLSQKFNSDKPELVADQLTEKAANGVQWLDGEHADGRTKPGQLYVTVSKTICLLQTGLGKWSVWWKSFLQSLLSGRCGPWLGCCSKRRCNYPRSYKSKAGQCQRRKLISIL